MPRVQREPLLTTDTCRVGQSRVCVYRVCKSLLQAIGAVDVQHCTLLWYSLRGDGRGSTHIFETDREVELAGNSLLRRSVHRADKVEFPQCSPCKARREITWVEFDGKPSWISSRFQKEPALLQLDQVDSINFAMKLPSRFQA